MHCQALVFGDQPNRLMDSLIRTSSRMPDDVSVPLEVSDTKGHSGWHIVNSDQLQFGGSGYGSWVHCVWPTDFLRDHLGPHALLSDGALSGLEVPRHQVQKCDGLWWAHVPRFFRTIGVRWSIVNGSSRWQGIGDMDAANGATVATLDLEHNLATHDPNLVVGPTGPVFYQEPDTPGRDVAQRRLDATLPLMGLPRSTPVTLVNWHDTERWESASYRSRRDHGNDERCTCYESEYAALERPYRDAPNWDY